MHIRSIALALSIVCTVTIMGCAGEGKVNVSPSSFTQFLKPSVSEPQKLGLEDVVLLQKDWRESTVPADRIEISKKLIETLRALSVLNASAFQSATELFPPSELREIAKELFETKNFDCYLNLVQIFSYTGVSISFRSELAWAFIQSVLNSENPIEIVQTTVSTLGENSVYLLLAGLSSTEIKNILEAKPNSVSKLLEATAFVFESKNSTSAAMDRWWNKFNGLQVLLDFEKKLDAGIPLEDALIWQEKLQRSLEMDLRSQPDTARAFLQELPSANLQAVWLKIRLLNADQVYRLGAEWSYAEPQSRLDDILKARISMWLQADKREAIQTFCALLERHSPRMKKVFVGNSADVKPGCYEFESIEPLSIRLDHFQMAFDSVLLSHGSSLHIQVERTFDASVMDFSTTRLIPQADSSRFSAGIAPAKEAIVFPVLVGIKVLGDPVIHDGTYFFPIHFPYQMPERGPLYADELPLEKGYVGGNLEIQISSENSFVSLPAFISQGSDGQKAPSPLPGGAADTSTFDPQPLRKYVEEIARENLPEFQNAPPVALSKLDLRTLEGFMKIGQKKEGVLQLYFSENYLLHLVEGKAEYNDQAEKVISICRQANLLKTKDNGLYDLTECFDKKIKPRLQQFLEQLIIDQAKNEPAVLNFHLPTVSTYSLPGGEPGTIHANGLAGADGYIILNGKEFTSP